MKVNLKGFNENQKKAVLHKDGACVVIAGAGSGKTKVLTSRIQFLISEGVKPYNILALTFTKKSAEEMKDRLAQLIGLDAEQTHVGTFHSICYRLLRDEWGDKKDSMKNVDLVKDWWVKNVFKNIVGQKTKRNPYGLGIQLDPKTAINIVSLLKNNCIGVNDEFPEWIANFPVEESKIRKMYKAYEDRKKLDNLIDFDDMLLLFYRKIENDKIFLAKCRDLFKYVLVDEYQDTNILQERILELICGEHRNVFVVGDDKQSIYSFRSGLVELILTFSQRWNAKVIPLKINYRSTKNIVDWSNRLISFNQHQLELTAIAYQGTHSDPTVSKYFDEYEESREVARQILEYMEDGHKPQDMCVLYRTNAQSRPFEDEMIKNDIPYIVLGSASFYDRGEIKDMLAYLRIAVNQGDDDSLTRIVNKPNRFLGKSFVDQLSLFGDRYDMSLYESLSKAPCTSEWRYNRSVELRNSLRKISEGDMSTVEIINYIRKEVGYDEWLMQDDSSTEENDENDRVEALNSIQSLAHKYSDPQEFIDYIEEISTKKNKSKNDQDKVKLMSLHRSKGLEFPIVFLVGFNSGLLPHSNADNLEEERRLAYVGMTRAEKYLNMSYVSKYQEDDAFPSDFLVQLMNSLQDEPIEDEEWF